MVETPRTEEQLAQETRCTAPEHLSGSSGRELVWRSCRAFLDGCRLTAIELLHSSHHQRRFADAGSSLTAAVQKIAIAQVAGGAQTVTERMRELYSLTDLLHKQTLGFEAAHPEADDPRTFAGLVASLVGSPAERRFAAFALITRRLAGLGTWAEKFAAVIALAAETAGGKALAYVDHMLADLLHSQAVVMLVLGDLTSLGLRLERLIDLMGGTAKLPESASTPAASFARLMAASSLPATYEALRGILARELSSDQTLVPGDRGANVVAELSALVQLRRGLECGGQYLGGSTAAVALEKRFARVVNDSTIAVLIGGAKTPADEAKALLPLHDRVLGSRAREVLRRAIEHAVKTPPTLECLLGSELSPPHRLKALVELAQSIAATNLPEGAKNQMSNHLNELYEPALVAFDPLGKIARRTTGSAERAMAHLDLCRSGILMPGGHLAKARHVAHRYLKAPDFLPSYLADTEDETAKTQKLQQLKARLIEAGLGGPGLPN